MEQGNTLPHSYIHRWKKYATRDRKIGRAKAQMTIATGEAVLGRMNMQSGVPF